MSEAKAIYELSGRRAVAVRDFSFEQLDDSQRECIPECLTECQYYTTFGDGSVVLGNYEGQLVLVMHGEWGDGKFSVKDFDFSKGGIRKFALSKGGVLTCQARLS